jgi:hypothetical protein
MLGRALVREGEADGELDVAGDGEAGGAGGLEKPPLHGAYGGLVEQWVAAAVA